MKTTVKLLKYPLILFNHSRETRPVIPRRIGELSGGSSHSTSPLFASREELVQLHGVRLRSWTQTETPSSLVIQSQLPGTAGVVRATSKKLKTWKGEERQREC